MLLIDFLEESLGHLRNRMETFKTGVIQMLKTLYSPQCRLVNPLIIELVDKYWLIVRLFNES